MLAPIASAIARTDTPCSFGRISLRRSTPSSDASSRHATAAFLSSASPISRALNATLRLLAKLSLENVRKAFDSAHRRSESFIVSLWRSVRGAPRLLSPSKRASAGVLERRIPAHALPRSRHL